MTLDIIQQEIYTGSINIRATHVILLSLSPSAPYLATMHLSLHRIGCKHIPSYFAFPIIALCFEKEDLNIHLLPRELNHLLVPTKPFLVAYFSKFQVLITLS